MLIAGTVSAKRAKGTGGPAGDEAYNLVARPLAHGTTNNHLDASQQTYIPVAFEWQNGGTSKRTQIVRTGGEYAQIRASSIDAVMVAPTLGAGYARERYSNQQFFSQNGDGFPITPSGVRRLTPTECERLQGFPDGWTGGQSDSARYRQLGNAVTVNVIEWIGRRIMAAWGT